MLKSEQDVLGGMVVYRTTKEAAKAPAGPVKFDLIPSTVAKVPRKIPNPEQTRHVKYRVTLQGSEIAQVFPADCASGGGRVVGGQRRVGPQGRWGGGQGAVILEIKSVGPLDGEAGDRRGRPPSTSSRTPW